MMGLNLLVFSLFGLVGVCVGQFVQNGQCNSNLPLATNFDVRTFTGTWYEVARSWSPRHEGDCASLDINIISETETSTVLNVLSSSVRENFAIELNGTAVYENGTARLRITFPEFNNPVDFWVLDTEPSAYAILYACENISLTQRSVYVWQILRTNAYPNEMVPALINTTLNNVLGVNSYELQSVSHSNFSCYVLPIINEGEPIILPGQCDSSIPVVQNFDVSRFTGIWHNIASYYSENARGECNRAEYTLNNGVLTVVNSQVTNQALQSISGTATVSNDRSARLTVTFNIGGANVQQEIWVLATDYNNHAVLYSCDNIGSSSKRIYSWILSRRSELSSSSAVQVNEVINSIVELNNAYYETRNHTSSACFYYPPAVRDQPVVFRGQCDPNIRVVQNFNAVRYMGLWHDTESYPSRFRQGTCSNANYRLSDRGVDVVNSQVVNQTLNTINGLAVVTSTDGSAKLQVTFSIGGQNRVSDYWVLATDYDSYALVYSCRNLENNNREVTTWKLSRSKQMPAAATAIINNVVNSVDVLDQRYYQSVDQSTTGCYYVPEPQEGVPVVFPGQCDLNIPTVANFDFNRFAGTWNEIQSYPKTQQPGHCISHQFTVGATNTFNVQSSNIYDQFRDSAIGTASQATGQPSGRLTMSIRINGTDLSFPYWVVATDYSNYALIYSCVNIAEDFRGIWSWKLSRTRSLSQAQIDVMNIAMTNIDVLDNRFFEEVDHSDEACFYLPEIAPGQPIILPGQCDPNINVVQNFNATRYLGRWRLVEAYQSDTQRGTCQEANYWLGPTGSVVVFNTEVINQTLATITGDAVPSSTDGSGKLAVTFPGIPVPFEYWILATDYDDYALVYGCVNVNSQQRRIWSFKLSRTNTLSENATIAINQVVRSVQVLNQRYFLPVDRSNAGCFYYPEPNNEPVVFRGQCENIPVVQNFRADAYMGLWHQIESYPAPFQSGTCHNALYTLVGGTVEVFNTQVINQTLDTINGTGVLATTDGSAKLLVNFPIAGTNITALAEYWVLDTDYSTYSIVYSCRNINEEERSVTSWKLSRTKELSSFATASINSVVNSVDVLDQRYYEITDQSRDGCFYFPEPQQDVQVVFPGQCDPNLPVVRNFNMELFQGTWHEIEAYPKDDQPGQCINHQFTAESNGRLSLISNNVVDLTLGVSTGNVTFVSNDGSARLNIRIESNGTIVDIPYWIVSTDYSTYALAYSCVNLNNDFRGVWSWKLSRTRQLPAAASTAINNAIANIDVLDNRYYQRIDQSDNACFYLPEFRPGQPVEFVGQCDPNIPVVRNLDSARYFGLWRLVESYHSNFQGGTCNEATYSAGAGGAIIVHNTQVVNQELREIFGTAVGAADGSGKLTVTFPNSPAPSDYWILDTDYENYSLIYSCVNITRERRRVWSWKMSRTNYLTQNANNAIDRVVSRVNVLDNRYFRQVDRSDAACFYYPAPSNDPVVFRGQCEQNIPVVQNFDLNRYMGTWYDIQSYPTPFQRGTCNTAQYTLNTGITVVNTQVVDQQLRTMTGSAAMASTDGSARLTVSFIVGGVQVNTDYWVLATDYTSYALVYSCRNIDAYRRQVHSWKLSRSRSLTPAANTAINNVLNTVQVLRQDYFVARDHSAVGCFYYPDNFGGDVILDGVCVPDNQVQAVNNFNLNNFAGTWHEVARFPSDLQNGECAATQYEVSGPNSFSVTQSIVRNERQQSRLIPSASATSGGRGVISASISGVPISNLFILATDYNEYALAYSCRNLGNNRKQIYSWKLSRSRTGLSANANRIIDELVSNNIDLFEGYYRYTEQSNEACFHYPVFPVLPDAIILPGPCDTTIRAVPNFDINAFSGRWLEVARYPQRTQTGQCNRAEYTPNNNGINVTNSQVINQTLNSISGSAVVVSTDNTGLLNVTFVIRGVARVANYYVLATDYTNYALIYNCHNLEDGTRRVGSWKFSRTPSLSVQANNIMDVVISSTQGLLEEYYQPTSQSEESCFYVPEVNPNSAPVFRGQCENVQAVQNFDMARYLGWWHEIESFPVDNLRGECISSQYQSSGSQYRVVDTSVANGNATVVTGTVVASPDGRLTRTLSNGVVEEILVLATDYETYSLLYSCVNVGTESRRIWSAKHSKSRQLTQAAQNAMASAINSNRVLYPQFYLPVDQSDRACFHYPEQTGRQIILPGQCDMNIPVVENFDVAAYGGTWYQIEKYPQIHESGSCVGARYTLDADRGVVNVLNWEVIDGVLMTINGTAVPQFTDGTARLLVTLPIVGTNATITTSLYVLATDYQSYSLAYSCFNINSFQRSIGAWKLSRTRTMPASGTTAINAVIQRREELHQPFFVQTEQNDRCEEPSSGLIVKSSIIVLLVCAFLQLLA